MCLVWESVVVACSSTAWRRPIQRLHARKLGYVDVDEIAGVSLPQAVGRRQSGEKGDS